MASSAENAALSRTEHVFEALRFEILESRILPGERLKFIELAQKFGISQTVVREALARLAEQGLVVASPKRGFTVMPLSVDDLKDLTRVRIELETMALRDSMKHGDLAWESTVVAAHHTLERTPFVTEAPASAATWRQMHRAFHQALCSGSISPRLKKVVSELRDSADLYRIWARSLGKGKGRNVAAEHLALLNAAVGRDADQATVLLAEHIQRTTDDLIAVA